MRSRLQSFGWRWTKRAGKALLFIPIAGAVTATAVAGYAHHQGYPSMSELSKADRARKHDPLIPVNVRFALEDKEYRRVNAYKYWRKAEESLKNPSNSNPLILEHPESKCKVVVLGTSHEAGDQSKAAISEILSNYHPSKIAVEMDIIGLHYFLTICEIRAPKTFRFNEIRLFMMNNSPHPIRIALDHQKFERTMKRMEKNPDQVVNNRGEEFVSAVLQAAKHDLDLVLIDRRNSKTLQRIFRALMIELWDSVIMRKGSGVNVKHVSGVVPDLFNSNYVNREHVRTLSRDLSAHSFFKTSLLVERDLVMTRNLKRLSGEQKGGTILAIVGCGHLDGIESYWNIPDESLEELYEYCNEDL